MFICHKCSKPVFFAERKQSLGYDWHPECLRCQECGKRLNPGQHAEHKGVPYCHVPCYGALFGPQLFGHGTRVESHKSFGQKTTQKICSGPQIPLAQIESKLKLYNQFYDNKSLEIRSREVNGRLVLEGAVRIYWGIQGIIHLKEDDDQRTVVTIRKRNSVRYPNSVDIIRNTLLNELEPNSFSNKENTTSTTDNETTISESLSYDTVSMSSDINSLSTPNSSKETSPAHISTTLPSRFDVKQLEWDEIDDLLQVERKVDDAEHVYRTMPSHLPSRMTGSTLSDISTDLSIDTDDITTSTTTTSYKTLTGGNDSISGGGSSESQTIYYSPLQSSNEKSPDGPLDSNTNNNHHHNVERDEDEDEDTPTLKNCDFEDFKKQAKKDYITSANNMKNVTDGTLKFNQPIDPSRINDSLKLYSESIMSKSMNEDSPGMYSLSNSCFIPGQINSFNINDTLNLLKNNQSSSSSSDDKTLKHESNKISPYLKKSVSMGATSSSDSHVNEDSWAQSRGLLKSKSGPNYVLKDEDDDDGVFDTIKPSGKTSSISIKMDCYDEILKNNSTTSSSASTTPTTPTSQSETYVTADTNSHYVNEDGVMLRRRPKPGSVAIKRRSGNRRSRTKVKRRCSINGHYYDRETSFFTPPRGSAMTVWVSSMVNTQEVINLVMEKYKIESKAENFGLYIVRDNGEQKRLKCDDFPLVSRVILGPHEDVAKLFLMDVQQTQEISPEVAQFLNLSIPECHAILHRYDEEEDRELQRIKEKFTDFRRRIKQRMESLKVRL